MMTIATQKTIGSTFKVQSRWLLILAIFLSLPVSAASLREQAVLQPYWSKLDAAREYRADFVGANGERLGLTHADFINNYLDTNYFDASSPYAGQSPQELFIESVSDFRAALISSNAAVAAEARLGLQEAQNEYLAGQSLLGNNALVKGLRTRFPGADPISNTESLLSEAINQFDAGINSLVDDLRSEPNGFRAVSANPLIEFPFYVENTVTSANSAPSVVESDLYRFTQAVNRRGEAGNSFGKYLFFTENVMDQDNFPTGNWPTVADGDLDINGDGIFNSAGREDAVVELKAAAQGTYLNSILLASIQSPREFAINGGGELKRTVLDANRTFEDILSGFNPLLLQGDFIPHSPVNAFLSNCSSAAAVAVSDQESVNINDRQYDVDQTLLRDEILARKTAFLNSILAATGFTEPEITATSGSTGFNQTVFNILDPESRLLMLEAAEKRAANSAVNAGLLGTQYLAVQQSSLDVEIAAEQLRQIPERIRIEEQRSNAVANVVLKNGRRFAALSLAEGLAGAIKTNIGQCGVGACNFIEFNPGAAVIGSLRGSRDVLQAIQQSTIENISSAATIKQMLLDQAIAYISLERAVAINQQQSSIFEEALAQLQRDVRDYVVSQENLAAAYYQNPAYRILKDQAINDADLSFQTAMRQCFRATKALEYAWSENFNNPIPDINGLLATPLEPTYSKFHRAESVFAVGRAQDIQAYYQALSDWDFKMRGLRGADTANTGKFILLKRDIFGYDGGSQLSTLLFDNLIRLSRVAGANPQVDDLLLEFSIEIGDQKLFPDHPNIKIESIELDLKSKPGTSGVLPPAQVNAPVIDLVMLDQATVRTFFANTSSVDDDLISYELEESRSLDRSQFSSSISAKVDGFINSIANPINTQLAGHSPAVSRWVLHIDMSSGENSNLILENIDEIWIAFRYTYNRPAQFSFN